MSVDLDVVQRTMAQLLQNGSNAIHYHDRHSGEVVSITPDAAASASGLLPALLVAGEAVWRDITGKGFDLDIQRDREALLGYRLRGIGAANFATVMLATMEATDRTARNGVIVINHLNAVWSATTAALIASGSRPAHGASPAP